MGKNMRFESGVLAVLSLMLVGVFALSVHMYDYLAADAEDGTLAVLANNVREFMDENEAVAAFLGVNGDWQPDATDIDVNAEAAAYIERYNSIYERFE